MKKVLLTAALASLGSAACAQDWSGAYAGAQAASSSFSNVYVFSGDPASDNPFDGGSSMSGVYAGYNRQIGNMVLGGEIAYLSGKPGYDTFPESYFYSDMLDLKLGAG